MTTEPAMDAKNLNCAGLRAQIHRNEMLFSIENFTTHDSCPDGHPHPSVTST